MAVIRGTYRTHIRDTHKTKTMAHASGSGRNRMMRSNTTEVADADDIIKNRKGLVLGKDTILKSDHFPGAHNKKLVPRVEGAPNFRQVESLPIYGVAIPTIEGIENVFSTITKLQDIQKFYWHNMREEPVLYINGKPYVLREVQQPFANVEYTGIDFNRVEEMEIRLKQDVLVEVSKFGGIMVCGESKDGDLVNNWECVERDDIQTPAEVYDDFKKQGYDVVYMRIPVTDERSPKETDFDMLMKCCSQSPEDAALIFNCQMGRGRTTTAMIVASLLAVRSRMRHGGIPSWACNAFCPDLADSPREDAMSPQLEDRLKSGDFAVIRSLLRVLEKGYESKIQIDSIIDACASFQNLRESIVTYRERFLKAGSESQRNNLQRVVIDYLERYFMLITFTSYLNTVAPDANLSREDLPSFQDWFLRRDELHSVKERLLWHNPLTAIEVHTSYNTGQQINQDSDNLGFITLRSGSVLGSHTILKDDHYPGLQSSILPRMEGAPNFRQACEGLPVFGLAIPSKDGIRRVLEHIGVTPETSERTKVMWFNMREEPVIYVNGHPHVLREHARPFKNMQEYSKIGTSRVESMERRLKKDVLKEASGNNSSVLVTREIVENGVRMIEDEWEKINLDDPSSVLTPLDIFQSLSAEGYPLEYVRIPVTDGRAPQLSDIDAIVAEGAFADANTLLVFNCQGGAGRTTTGMVIGSLLYLRKGNKLSMLSHSVLHSLVRRTSDCQDDYNILDVSQDHGYSDEYVDSEREIESDMSRILMDGNYVVIQRLLYLLDYGQETKDVVDIVINACGKLKNLRKAIFAYRRPRKNWGPSWGRGDESIQSRHAAFRRGIEYLERYFILIAFSCWLDSEHYDEGRGSFHAWISTRTDIKELKKAIRANPGAALSATFPNFGVPIDVDTNIQSFDQKLCLSSRNGLLFKNNSILKSYIFPEIQMDYLSSLPDVINYFKAEEVPIATANAPNLKGMRSLVDSLGGGVNGDAHVIVIDMREELVMYVNGTPYVLREINFATKSLSLIGISASQVVERETQLKSDIIEESKRYRGQILLHREVSRSISRNASFLKPKDSGSFATDITKQFDRRPDAQSRHFKLEAFWEEVDKADNKLDILTAQEIWQNLKDEGYKVDYMRYPLSRERTPTAKDVEILHTHFHSFSGDSKNYRYVFISHTGTGSAMRYAPVILSCYLKMVRNSLPSSTDSNVIEANGDLQPLDSLENRGILALTRVIPEGPKCKALVDESIKYFSTIGDIRKDIQKCKKACDLLANEHSVDELNESHVAARLLGLNYLQRYFYLITYACYVNSHEEKSFTEWMKERSELGYLLDNLKFD